MGSLSLQRLCVLGALELVLVLALNNIHGSFAAQGSNCSIAILTPLLPCLPYLQAGNTSAPTSDCCTPIQSLFATADPACLCQIPPLAQQIGVTLNQTRALEIVSLCNETVPASVLSCLSTIAPLGAPPSSPSPKSSSAPANPSTSTPPPQTGNENSSAGRGLAPPYSSLLAGSVLVALFLHLEGFSIPA